MKEETKFISMDRLRELSSLRYQHGHNATVAITASELANMAESLIRSVKPKPEKKYQVYLMGYSHTRGHGRFFNYRQDGLPPTFQDIESMEKKIEASNGIDGVNITSCNRIADSDDLG